MDYRKLSEKIKDRSAVVCVVGLGYVGLPLAAGFARAGLKVVGFDINQKKIEELKNGIERMNELTPKELEEIKGNMDYTTDPKKITISDFAIICVPTPVTEDYQPDLEPVNSAAEIVGKHMKKNVVVCLESTVYPGVTEGPMKQIVERESKQACGRDFSLCYSPERINPGDREHTLKRVVKVVGGMNPETTEVMASLYDLVTEAGVHKAKDIATAEAAKVIENIQRDLNIALMNELSMIFDRMGLSTRDVLAAADTKWNFHKYTPGMVGGHCIPVDPYYLVQRAREFGYDAKVILAGRETNNSVPYFIASLAEREMKAAGKKVRGSRILVLGVTFKKNVNDTRNSPSKHLIKKLKDMGAEVFAHDPLVSDEEIEKRFCAKPLKDLRTAKNMDCVVMSTDHDIFRSLSMKDLKSFMRGVPVLIDGRMFYPAQDARAAGLRYASL